jgi:deoxyribonuclease-4
VFFGAHTSDNGGIHMAARRAAKGRMGAMQLFSAMPQFYGDKTTIKPERADRFRRTVAEVGLDASKILVHAAYVLNTASPEPDKYVRAKAGLAKELERTTTLGVMGFCFHPGSAGSSDPKGAIERIAEAMVHALESASGSARVLIENTAGAGRTIGKTPEEVAGILALVPAPLRTRAGYGLDTCHLYASGLDITKSRAAFTDVLDRFCDAIGEPPAFFHLNDSEGALGSNRDRHTLIGTGQIGELPFRWLVADARAQNVPLILETPQLNPNVAEDDESPDEYEVSQIRKLETFAEAGVADA